MDFIIIIPESKWSSIEQTILPFRSFTFVPNNDIHNLKFSLPVWTFGIQLKAKLRVHRVHSVSSASSIHTLYCYLQSTSWTNFIEIHWLSIVSRVPRGPSVVNSPYNCNDISSSKSQHAIPLQEIVFQCKGAGNFTNSAYCLPDAINACKRTTITSTVHKLLWPT